MQAGLAFAVLDSVRAWRDGTELDLGTPQQRGVLALLLLSEGRRISVDELAEAVWGVHPPRAARGTLRTYVHRLRRVLGGDEEESIIESTTDGYVLPVDSATVDLGRFHHLAGAARVARRQGNLAEAAARLGDALSLWHGTPLAGARGAYVDGRRARLTDTRMATWEELLELKLDLGEHSAMTGEVRAALAAEPLRERLRELLMLALYRSGRAAEALIVYADARQLHRRELGVDPGPGLQNLHRRILRSDPALSAPPDQPPPVETAALKPAQLPADLPVFVGRSDALAEALALLPAGADPPSNVVVGVVSGTAGVGKTAFAVHWAHRVADRFPDGQLYVNLRGFDTGEAALDPGDAIRWFLEALNVPPHQIPDDLSAKTALYRSLLAGRHYLVFLDNARDAEQARHLLPGTPGCLAIVTSRRRLPGLVTSAGAHPITLELLSVAEADEFLSRRLGAGRVRAEPEAARAIAAACARLPLALAVAAARAGQHTFTLSAVVAELSATRGSLDAFAGPDRAMDVRAVLSWSYQALSPAAARMFRLLSVHPGDEVTVPAGAALAALPARSARAVLRELAGAHLLTELTPGRYAWHDILQAYATELLETCDPEDEHRIAFQRLLEYHLHSTDAAFRRFSTYRELRPLPPHLPGVVPADFADDEQALGWLVTEYAILLGMTAHAATRGFHAHTSRLAWALQHFQDRQGHWHDLATVQRTALLATRRLGDRVGMAYALGGNARAAALFGRFEEAHRHLDEAHTLFADVGDNLAMAYNQTQRASVYNRQGDHPRSLHHAEQALVLCREAGNRLGQAGTLNNIGWFYARLGDYERAIDHCEQALAMYEGLDNRIGQANTLDSLGYAHHHLGRHRQAVDHYQRALSLYRALGDRSEEIDTLVNLGETYHAAGLKVKAREVVSRALSTMTDLNLPGVERVRIQLLELYAPEPARSATTGTGQLIRCARRV